MANKKSEGLTTKHYNKPINQKKMQNDSSKKTNQDEPRVFKKVSSSDLFMCYV